MILKLINFNNITTKLSEILTLNGIKVNNNKFADYSIRLILRFQILFKSQKSENIKIIKDQRFEILFFKF